MAYSLSPWLKPRFFITGTNRPLAGGLMYTYKAGTTDPATTYSDDSGTENTNPIVLDTDGQCDLYLDDAVSYRIILKNALGVTQFDKDRVASIGSTQVQSFNSIAALLLRSGTTIANAAKTLGYYSAGDGGGNSFYWDGTSTATDNGGTVIKPTSVSGAGRWLAVDTELTTLKQWGCVGDGTITDDSTKINAYLTYMAANGYKATGVGDYRIDSKVTVKGNADFSDATFNVYGSLDVAVDVSTGSATNPTDYLDSLIVTLPNVKNMGKVGIGWGTGIGVRTVNLYSCIVIVQRTNGFGIGFQAASYGAKGNVYNNYHLGWLENNKVNVNLYADGSTAWVNDNLFIGGRCSHESGEGTNVAGTRHILISKATTVNNNNVFLKTSIEGDVAEYHVECGGSYNAFNELRWEATTPKILYTGDNVNEGARNIIFGGYNTQRIVYTYVGTTGTKNKTIAAGGGNYETVNVPIGIQNSSSSANDIYRLYEASTIPETAGENDWSLAIGSQFIQGKAKADAYPRLKLNFNSGKIYFDNGTTAAPTKYIGAYGTDNFAFNNDVFAYTDNAFSCGTAARRWTVIYATTATINTSDARSKQQITTDLAPELRAWAKVEFCKYKLNDAVEKKGDGARWHFGVIAQQVKKAFEDEGLDPFEYGILCYDEWDEIEEIVDENGIVISPKVEAGNKYGIRYEEALILECAFLRSKIK